MTEADPFHGFNDPVSQTIGQIADQTLLAMEAISASANAQFQRGAAGSAGALRALNGFNNPEVGRNIGLIQGQAQRAAHDLQREPFIARVTGSGSLPSMLTQMTQGLADHWNLQA